MQVWTRQYSSQRDNPEEKPDVRTINEPFPLKSQNAGEQGSGPVLIPVSTAPHACGAVIVPPGFAHRITINGAAFPSGIHLLKDQDRLEFEGSVYWVAATHQVEIASYDSDVHGADQYCFITRVRLKADERIVVCPGNAGVACGVLYRQPAWEMVLESTPSFRCPRCGFDPNEPEWKPAPDQSSSLPRLFDLARRRGNGGHA